MTMTTLALPQVDLPACVHRRPSTGGDYRCESPQLVAPGAVTGETCRRCGLDRTAGAKAPAAAPRVLQPRCPHLWKRVREGGRVVTRRCGTCPGATELDVFHCRCPGRRQPGGEHDRVTLADCQGCVYRPRPGAGRKLLLVNHLSPGDVLCLTAAVHSLHRTHPGEFVTAVDTSAPALWDHNPDVVLEGEGFERVQTHYPLVHESNQRAVHVLEGYCAFLEENLKVRVPLLVNRPLLYLSPEEKSWMGQVQEVFGHRGKFWLLGAGRKQDFSAKFWGSENYQRLVDLLRGRVLFVQVGAAEHHHPPLRGVLNLVGRTDLRQLVRLVWHADGAVGGTTLLMHLAAALEKPYVCVQGGREPVSWNAYPRSHQLHTVGSLPCCKEGGCWRSRTVALGDGSEQDKSLCDHPVPGPEPVPRCLELIRPEYVAETVLRCAWHGATQ
jgi:ADP-heptose:LPS heptosyltransferase